MFVPKWALDIRYCLGKPKTLAEIFKFIGVLKAGSGVDVVPLDCPCNLKFWCVLKVGSDYNCLVCTT